MSSVNLCISRQLCGCLKCGTAINNCNVVRMNVYLSAIVDNGDICNGEEERETAQLQPQTSPTSRQEQELFSAEFPGFELRHKQISSSEK